MVPIHALWRLRTELQDYLYTPEANRAMMQGKRKSFCLRRSYEPGQQSRPGRKDRFHITTRHIIPLPGLWKSWRTLLTQRAQRIRHIYQEDQRCGKLRIERVVIRSIIGLFYCFNFHVGSSRQDSFWYPFLSFVPPTTLGSTYY
jgi:hypothetical protein